MKTLIAALALRRYRGLGRREARPRQSGGRGGNPKSAVCSSLPKRLPFYQTLGDLTIRFHGPREFTDCTRELDLNMAIVRVRYPAGDTVYAREVWASAPGQTIVIRLTADKPNRIGFAATLSRERDATTHTVSPDRVIMDGEAIARDPRHDGERKVGVKF